MGRLVPTWSLSVCYLVCTWTLSGLYAILTLSLWSQYGSYVVPIWPAWSQHGPYPAQVLTGKFMINIWSICGLYMVPSWSCMFLTWFLCVPYMLLHGPYLVLVPSWSLRGPYLILLVPRWSLCTLYGPLMRYLCGLTCSLHGLHGPYEVPTRPWSAWPLPGPTWSLPGLYLVPTF
jgi:hypothetical protein